MSKPENLDAILAQIQCCQEALRATRGSIDGAKVALDAVYRTARKLHIQREETKHDLGT